MTKKEIKDVFDAVICAASRDRTRENIFDRIAVYAQGEDWCFVATDGHRMHYIANAPIDNFREETTPLTILLASHVKRYLAQFRPTDEVDMRALYGACVDPNDIRFPPAFDLALWPSARDLEMYEGRALVPQRIEQKYLGDLAKFPLTNGMKYVNKGDALAPMFVYGYDAQKSLYGLATIMPMRL